MKLEGSLDAFSLPDIFQLLSFTKKSGGLRLSNAGADGVVYFADGLLTGASADGVRQALARRLIGSGAVDDEALTAAVAAADERRGVGPLLMDAGAVDLELVQQAATEQTMDSVFDLLRWPAGDFAFNVDVANPDDVGIRLAPDVVVAEAGQRQAAWDAVASVIPGPDTILAMPVVLAVEPSVSRDEWALLALVDGRRRVGDLVELTGCGQFAVVSTLAALVGRGLLQVSDPQDHVATVARRQALLAPLEGVSARAGAASPIPAQGAGDESPVSAEAPESSDEPDDSGDVIPQAADDTEADEAVAPTEAESDDDSPSDEAAEDTSAEVAPEPEIAAPDLAASVVAAVEAMVEAPAAPRELAPLLGRAHVPGDVVPTRPEPFLPQRRPEHPEAPAARLTGLPAMNQSGGSAAVATEPETSGLIERDPSVNRSLLLRLIAGVRGL